MPERPDAPRKRGAPPGNQNAVRHGLYSKANLTANQCALMEAASQSRGDGMAELVDVLRMEIARLVTSGDYQPAALAMLAQAVVKAALAEAKLAGSTVESEANAALANVLADVVALRARPPETPPHAAPDAREPEKAV